MHRAADRTLGLAATLLVLAASRVLQLRGLELNQDEIWTIWQTLGSPRQVLAWTPYDWPPLYYLALAAWKEVAGLHPLAARYFSVLIFLPGAALLYRAIRREASHRAGWFAMLAYGALSYMVVLSVAVRGYALMMTLLVAALWLMQRYFYRPTLRRGLALGLTLSALLYTHLTSMFAIVALVAYSLALAPRSVWRWWLPGLVTGALLLPEALAKADIVLSGSRLDATQALELPPLPTALADLFELATGELAAIWAALALVSAVAILARGGRMRGQELIWMLWTIGGAVVLYVTNPLTGFFRLRYGLWLLVGLAVWIGAGVAHLPRWGQVVAAGVLAAGLLVPLSPAALHDSVGAPPMMMVFDWLRTQVRWGDVMVVDEAVDAPPEAWDYYTRLYFPHGLTFVHAPADQRRVWFATVDGSEDPVLSAAVREGRVPGRYVGPWNFLVRLYEGPPDRDGILFDNGMRFHGVDIIRPGDEQHQPVAWREGETIALRLWWSVDYPVQLDYSVSIRFRTPEGETLVQVDGAPQVAGEPPETSRWQPGRFYIDERTLRLPDAIPSGSYPLFLIVYQWWDNTRIPVPGMTDEYMLPLDTIAVKAW